VRCSSHAGLRREVEHASYGLYEVRVYQRFIPLHIDNDIVAGKPQQDTGFSQTIAARCVVIASQ
jgi:hypothetical protein